MSRLIRIYTVCHSNVIFWLASLFASVRVSKFEEGIFHFRNSGMKGLNSTVLITSIYNLKECLFYILWTRFKTYTITFDDCREILFWLPDWRIMETMHGSVFGSKIKTFWFSVPRWQQRAILPLASANQFDLRASCTDQISRLSPLPDFISNKFGCSVFICGIATHCLCLSNIHNFRLFYVVMCIKFVCFYFWIFCC